MSALHGIAQYGSDSEESGDEGPAVAPAAPAEPAAALPGRTLALPQPRKSNAEAERASLAARKGMFARLPSAGEGAGRGAGAQGREGVVHREALDRALATLAGDKGAKRKARSVFEALDADAEDRDGGDDGAPADNDNAAADADDDDDWRPRQKRTPLAVPGPVPAPTADQAAQQHEYLRQLQASRPAAAVPVPAAPAPAPAPPEPAAVALGDMSLPDDVRRHIPAADLTAMQAGAVTTISADDLHNRDGIKRTKLADEVRPEKQFSKLAQQRGQISFLRYQAEEVESQRRRDLGM